VWKFLVKLAVNGVAIWAAASVVPGVDLATEHLLPVVLVALVFALVNSLVKPLLVVLGLPFIVLSLGLFLLVINGLLLGLTASLTSALAVSGFGAAVLGSIVVSLVSWCLESVVGVETSGE
jgi:putative membrane protein